MSKNNLNDIALYFSKPSDNKIFTFLKPTSFTDNGDSFSIDVSNIGTLYNGSFIEETSYTFGYLLFSEGGGSGSGLENIVEDLTPQLGGDLYGQDFNIFDIEELFLNRSVTIGSFNNQIKAGDLDDGVPEDGLQYLADAGHYFMQDTNPDQYEDIFAKGFNINGRSDADIVLAGGGHTPLSTFQQDLQNVTDEGNITDNDIIVEGFKKDIIAQYPTDGSYSKFDSGGAVEVSNDGVRTMALNSSTTVNSDTGGGVNFNDGTNSYRVILPDNLVQNEAVVFPKKSGTVAFLDDVQQISLTTTGTTGVAALVGNVLNIPQYSSGGSNAYDPSSESGNNLENTVFSHAVLQHSRRFICLLKTYPRSLSHQKKKNQPS